MNSRLTLLIRLLYDPLQALARLQSKAPYLAGAGLALLASVIYYDVVGGDLLARWSALSARASSQGVFTPLILLLFLLVRSVIESAAPVLFLAAVFVPACLLVSSLVDRRSSFSVLLRQEYTGLTACALYGWAAAHILMLLPAWVMFESGGRALSPSGFVALRLVPLPYFVFLVTLALRTVLRLSYSRAVIVVLMSGLSLVALPLIPRLLYLLTSPFLLILVILVLRNLLGDMVTAQRARQNFERNLEASTLNPADASAHYNLGLIYQQRGQFQEARASFERAIEIDPDETDSHYQLGRIAREEGRLAESVTHFDAVVSRDPEHSQNEVWREIGRAYFQAGQYEDARNALERFLEKRPSDAEGRYHYGLTLNRLGLTDQAATEMRACIEAVRTSPAYKYRAEKHWMNEAQAFLRTED